MPPAVLTFSPGMGLLEVIHFSCSMPCALDLYYRSRSHPYICTRFIGYHSTAFGPQHSVLHNLLIYCRNRILVYNIRQFTKHCFHGFFNSNTTITLSLVMSRTCWSIFSILYSNQIYALSRHVTWWDHTARRWASIFRTANELSQ